MLCMKFGTHCEIHAGRLVVYSGEAPVMGPLFILSACEEWLNAVKFPGAHFPRVKSPMSLSVLLK